MGKVVSPNKKKMVFSASARQGASNGMPWVVFRLMGIFGVILWVR